MTKPGRLCRRGGREEDEEEDKGSHEIVESVGRIGAVEWSIGMVSSLLEGSKRISDLKF